MKILIVRLSSLGDILHLFPAVSDLRRQCPDAQIHWLVEPAFAQMVSWHSAVDKVITVPLRSHKKAWWKLPRLLRGLKRELKAENYDLVLDAQGLLKSALLARLAGVDIYGFHEDSARESLAARFYRKTARIAPGLHVIKKNRQLVAQLFGANSQTPADYGLDQFRQQQLAERMPDNLQDFSAKPYFVLLHGTTWNSKYWPESSWLELVRLLTEQGVHCLLPWGNEEEHQRAQRLQLAGGALAQVLPKLSLTELMRVLLHARGFVSVESGIGHIATVLDIPGIMLHGPTDPGYSGIPDKSCQHITSGLDCAPCFKRDCPKLESNGHGKDATPYNETSHARSPTPVPHLPKGEGYSTSLREFHVNEGIPPCQQKITPKLVFGHCLPLTDSNALSDTRDISPAGSPHARQ